MFTKHEHLKMMNMEIKCYTDGSASVRGANKGKGGFGTYFPNLFGEKKLLSKAFLQGKTGQMEIMALLYAIKAIPKECSEKEITLTVYSDSEYVVKTFTEGRLKKWILNNWRNSSGAVKNRDLWEQVIESLKSRPFMKLNMIHIRSHQVEKEKDEAKKALLLKDPNIRGNMVADYLADYKRHDKYY